MIPAFAEPSGTALRTFLLLLLVAGAGAFDSAAAVAQRPPTLADTMEERLVPCAICHGDKGEGKGAVAYYPRLSGKPARYLFLQLVAFREGRRKYPQMVYLVRHMPDAYLREIADYYAMLQTPHLAPAAPSSDPRERERGRTLVASGDAARNIPACVACHGKALTGTLPAIPGLVGLPTDYIAAQLGAWREGVRVATAPDCMHEIAQRLSGTDIAAVAKWLASQPALSTAPVPQGTTKLPLDCGSQH